MNGAAGQRRIPRATYRLQLTSTFTFRHAREVVAYLERLGISDLYLSPILRARPGSTHGYDVTSHAMLNPELGTDEDFLALADKVHGRGMGIIVDVVPNHMAVMTADNPWWTDVLENGPAARSARYFDIDWQPMRLSMHGRLLVPVLAAPFGEVLDKGELCIHFDAATGNFALVYLDLSFPLDPCTYPLIFRQGGDEVADSLPADPFAVEDFSSLLSAFAALPGPRETEEAARERRYRDKEVNKRRLVRLCERCPPFVPYIESVLRRLNGDAGRPQTFDRLEQLLAAQPYRLAFWRVSGEEINYRRFFDVDQLAALRVEDPDVFAAVHEKLAELLARGAIDGMRVDHADGLHDPRTYFERLRQLGPAGAAGGAPYVIVEKIVSAGETLCEDWQVDGTTGYEFGALVTGWLLDERQETRMQRIFRSYTHERDRYQDIVYESRRFVMRTSLAAEIAVLAIRLDRIAQSHRASVDFTYFALREALVEVIACFPVYRTYVTERGIQPEDRSVIARAVGMAMSRRQADRAVLGFLQDVLMGSLSFTSPRQAEEVLQFVMKFQQVTGPVMAKGTEDTAFYRYPCMLAANEVGADPAHPAFTTPALHEANRLRRRDWPHALLATSTHDTKRGEDVRYRLCALSEMPEAWAASLQRWRRLKRRNRGAGQIDPRDEYLLLQTLVAIWPAGESPAEIDIQALRQRLTEYTIKAAREAKIRTSWLDPDAEYEQALSAAVEQLLPEGREGGFHAYFRGLLEPVAFFGMLNALNAAVLKFTSPGVPDLYQGTELPRYVLVDPDNRRPVDFARLGEHLDHLDEPAPGGVPATVRRSLQQWHTGEIKLLVTWRLLELRRRHETLFTEGDYVELPVHGVHAGHLCAFARHLPGAAVIVVVSRWLVQLAAGESRLPHAEEWGDTRIELPDFVPAGDYSSLFSSDRQHVGAGSRRMLMAAALFDDLPVAVLSMAANGAT